MRNNTFLFLPLNKARIKLHIKFSGFKYISLKHPKSVSLLNKIEDIDMNDYYKTFIKKMTYITQMVDIYGQISVPEDFFEVSKTFSSEDDDRLNKNGIHEYGVRFKLFSLINEYKDEYKRILDSCGIKCVVRKDKTILFVAR